MTQRRLPGTSYETWVEKQIRAAMDEGGFDDLDGTGRPIADLDEPNDELRWVRQKLRREGFTFLPPSLALRKDAAEAREQARHARTEAEARAILDAINVRLVAAVRIPLAGPEVYVPPFDVDRALAQWHADHPAHLETPVTGPAAGEEPGRRRRPWRRHPRSC